ncbi:MAG: hypothetical protein RJA66_591 [Actinomycetota bacterium]|jgi:uncharacterized membrane protein
MTPQPSKVINGACNTEGVSELSTNSVETLPSPGKRFAWTLILSGILGWIAAFTLTLERIHVATNPDATLSCDLNPFISCKSVMLTEQARLLGFPNPLIGLAAFVFPIAVGAAILAGAKFALWFWRIFATGITMGFLFVLWLWVQSTFVINVLCPYCMVAWVAMVPLFWTVILFLIREGVIDSPIRLAGFFDRAYERVWLWALATDLLIATIIIVRFWSYWPALWK